MPLRSKLLTLMLLASVSVVLARPQLHDLDIRVVLGTNGDARITETRRMTIDGEGTECYIGLANMGPSTITDLSVSDETGLRFENVGDWDVDRSRDWKTGRCGIVTTRNGYELCWGLGAGGERTYVTSYTMTGMVRAYPDADALRHVFLDSSVSPKPEHARVLLVAGDSTLLFTPDSCGIWGFRFNGELSFQDGCMVAETTEAMNSEAALYIMAKFPKGMFAPSVQDEGTFEEKRQQAFEGSDYDSGDDVDYSDPETFFDILYVLAIFLAPAVSSIWYFVYVWRARRRVNKNLQWYRDIPLKGDLQEANNVLNAYKYGQPDYNNLLSACILKLVSMEAITIERCPDSKGRLRQNFVIHELKDVDRQPVLMRQIHNIFRMAAGNDTVLEPQELKTFMKSTYNESITDSLLNTLHAKTSISQYRNREGEVRQVLGLQKFLKEFTLMDERHLSEVQLWKDYMVYATLFGIADQVIREMKKVNPEYFNMDQVAGQMANDMTLPTIYSVMRNSTARAAMSKASREARAHGGGGHSSWHGGGGGFSGGGGGGGVR